MPIAPAPASEKVNTGPDEYDLIQVRVLDWLSRPSTITRMNERTREQAGSCEGALHRNNAR
jgi:hypothetical protein